MDQHTIKQLLDYDPQTGWFTWRVRRPPRGNVGARAGYDNGSGYIKISISGVKYYAHRLAFMWMLGVSPDTVDHINGDPSDNRWDNLRDVSQIENMGNALRGYGVRFRYGRWYARYSTTHLGVFATRSAAEACYREEKIRRAGLTPQRPPITTNPIQKRTHIKRTYAGKSLSHWAREWGIPQPTLYHRIVVQGRSFDEMVALRGTTKR